MKLQSFQFEVCDDIPANVENILPLLFFFVVDFMKKEPKTKFYGVFEHFSQTHEITKFWMIKLCFNVSDVTHVNEHTSYANCGLHVNFLNF